MHADTIVNQVEQYYYNDDSACVLILPSLSADIDVSRPFTLILHVQLATRRVRLGTHLRRILHYVSVCDMRVVCDIHL